MNKSTFSSSSSSSEMDDLKRENKEIKNELKEIRTLVQSLLPKKTKMRKKKRAEGSTELPDGWQMLTHSDGKKYYANATTQESSWKKPPPPGKF